MRAGGREGGMEKGGGRTRGEKGEGERAGRGRGEKGESRRREHEKSTER